VKPRRLLFPILAAAIAVSLSLAAAGCGGSESQSYAETLTGLREAALADEVYDGLEGVKDLPSPERETVEAFCLMTWKVVANREISKLSNIDNLVNRIRKWTVYGLDPEYVPAVDGAVDELRTAVDLDSFDPRLNGRYKRACDES
jgi:hypothetical protein